MDNFLKIFGDDIDPSVLPSELYTIYTICKDGNPPHFDDVLLILKALPSNERLSMKNTITTEKIMLVNDAPTATPDSSFSIASRPKCGCAQQRQQKYNVQAILSSSKTKLPLIKVASDFVDSRPNRRNDFGVFTDRILNNEPAILKVQTFFNILPDFVSCYSFTLRSFDVINWNLFICRVNVNCVLFNWHVFAFSF